jgi:hypothetical protein
MKEGPSSQQQVLMGHEPANGRWHLWSRFPQPSTWDVSCNGGDSSQPRCLT